MIEYQFFIYEKTPCPHKRHMQKTEMVNWRKANRIISITISQLVGVPQKN